MSMTVFDKGQGKKRIILTAVAVVLIAAILVGVVILNANSKHSSDGGGARYIEYEGKQYVLKDGIETFLVLGLDRYDGEIGDASYNNDQQADFLLLIVFDNYAKTYSSIHINRDTVAEMNVLGIGGKNVGTTKKQISLSHTYGEGGEISNKNTADAVSKLLGGVKINYTMSLTLDSVGIMNDLVGGVTVEILDDFSGVSGADELVKGEKVTLKGDQALLYVRSRKGLEDSSNSARMERQRQYLSALREKMSDCAENDANFYASFRLYSLVCYIRFHIQVVFSCLTYCTDYNDLPVLPHCCRWQNFHSFSWLHSIPLYISGTDSFRPQFSQWQHGRSPPLSP